MNKPIDPYKAAELIVNAKMWLNDVTVTPERRIEGALYWLAQFNAADLLKGFLGFEKLVKAYDAAPDGPIGPTMTNAPFLEARQTLRDLGWY